MRQDIEELARQVDRFAALSRKEYPHWRVEFHRSIDSTSAELRRRVQASSITQPTLVVAGYQEAGRGRQGRSWSSAPGAGLLFTAALPIAQVGSRASGFGRLDAAYPLTLMPLQLGLSIGLRLRLFGWRAHLKWPNDVVVDDHKVCGILTEAVDGWLLAGVGINLVADSLPAPQADSAQVQFPPGSLSVLPRDEGAVGHPYDLTQTLLQAVIAVLESPWDRERMLGWYRKWCVTLGQKVSREGDGGVINGTAKDIAADGSLVVEDAGGRLHHIANDVSIHGGVSVQ